MLRNGIRGRHVTCFNLEKETQRRFKVTLYLNVISTDQLGNRVGLLLISYIVGFWLYI
jgi:hypothetical protein